MNTVFWHVRSFLLTPLEIENVSSEAGEHLSSPWSGQPSVGSLRSGHGPGNGREKVLARAKKGNEEKIVVHKAQGARPGRVIPTENGDSKRF